MNEATNFFILVAFWITQMDYLLDSATSLFLIVTFVSLWSTQLTDQATNLFQSKFIEYQIVKHISLEKWADSSILERKEMNYWIELLGCILTIDLFEWNER